MFFSPITYHEPVFRPPAEANSAIIQATLGCSWNACAFCDMYASKSFKVREMADLQADIRQLAKFYQGIKKVFLADGNAFVLSANRLIPILEEINNCFGRIQRVSSYALPRDILSKTDKELAQIRSLGLKLLYIGVETGDDELLSLIHKNETYQSTVDGILKAQQAGIETSVMIINGLGGETYSQQHAIHSARLISEANPRFLSTLTLSMPFGLEHFQQKFRGTYIPQTLVALAKELHAFISHTETSQTIFRSDHVSNHLVLKGTLPKDKDALLEAIQQAIPLLDNRLYPQTPPVL